MENILHRKKKNMSDIKNGNKIEIGLFGTSNINWQEGFRYELLTHFKNIQIYDPWRKNISFFDPWKNAWKKEDIGTEQEKIRELTHIFFYINKSYPSTLSLMEILISIYYASITPKEIVVVIEDYDKENTVFDYHRYAIRNFITMENFSSVYLFNNYKTGLEKIKDIILKFK